MPAGQTGFDDITFDLISVQYHSLKAGHDYGQYVRDAHTAGREDIAEFFEQVMSQDAERAHKCHDYLRELES
jgi:rubrerythrin